MLETMLRGWTGGGAPTSKPFSEATRDGALRIGVIDVGSNSVRLVAFDAETRPPAIFFNEKVLAGLGEDLATTGRLSPEGRTRAMGALRRFRALTDGMGLCALETVATAAIRDAEDGPEFVEQVRGETGLTVRIASGADEARLSAQGVMLGEPTPDGVVADIGGASMELVRVGDGRIGEGVTTPLGPLRLAAHDLSGAALDAHVDAALAAALDGPDGAGLDGPETLFIVGGGWRALVKAHMAAIDYPLRVLHGFALSPEAAIDVAAWGASLSHDEAKSLSGSSDRRVAVIGAASQVLDRLVRRLRPGRVAMSAFGLREGVLWELLPPELRAQDPLLQPCARIEARQARRPGFGAEVWEWIRPAFPEFGPQDVRLAQAVCLLCDASWRTHPDYRGQANFELVTRNSFGGVDHADRMFMGTALSHRYKDAAKALRGEPAAELISRERAGLAAALGRGVRFGAMLGAASQGVLPQCPLRLEPARADGVDVLSLALPGAFAALDGEELRKRFRQFADARGVQFRIDL